MWWLFLCLSATLLWGTSYSLLKPIGLMSPLILQCLTGFGQILLGSIVLIISFSGNWNEIKKTWQISLDSNTKILLLITYILLNFIASNCYLRATQLPNVSIAIITSISSCYPIITTLLAILFYNEAKNISLSWAIPGFFFNTLGCILLAFSKN